MQPESAEMTEEEKIFSGKMFDPGSVVTKDIRDTICSDAPQPDARIFFQLSISPFARAASLSLNSAIAVFILENPSFL